MSKAHYYHIILKRRVQGFLYDVNVMKRPVNIVVANVGVYDKERRMFTINKAYLSEWLARGASCSAKVTALLINR